MELKYVYYISIYIGKVKNGYITNHKAREINDLVVAVRELAHQIKELRIRSKRAKNSNQGTQN